MARESTSVPEGVVEMPIAKIHLLRNHFLVGLTGTTEKFTSLLDTVAHGETMYPDILGYEHFFEAGQAREPITPDSVALMLGKQAGQLELFLEKLSTDRSLKDRLENSYLLLASNDVNTVIAGEPMTKSPLQKEVKLGVNEYTRLITASLRYLSMKHCGEAPNYSWQDLMSSWQLIDSCLELSWGKNVLLPIDYQTIDAFDWQQLVPTALDEPNLEKRGSTVAVVNRAYAHLELDWTEGNSKVCQVVNNYLQANWHKSDFTPDRYPTGIRQNELLRAFAASGASVLLSDHVERDGLPLTDLSQLDKPSHAIEAALARIESLLNGFSQSSMEIARRILAINLKDDANKLFVVTRKPGMPDLVETRTIPAWKK